MKAAAGPDWTQQRERSHAWVLRLMVWLSRTFGRRVGRAILRGIAAYYLLFAGRARRASRDYLARALGRPATWAERYRHMFSFASTVHDRVFLLGGRERDFAVEVHGAPALLAACEAGPGALLVGAHLGSFEVMRAMGRERAGLRVAMAMFEDNARKINATLQAINPAAVQDIIPLGQLDAMITLRDRLDEGCLVGILADRSVGDEPGALRPFLGEAARFPIGPWRLAAMLRRPVFFMTGLYLGGNRYRLHFEPLADFSDVPRERRQAAIDQALDRYVATLERYTRAAPDNWFNFYDFWRHP